MQDVLQRLQTLRRTARSLLAVERAAVVTAITLGAMLAWGAMDALVRFPTSLRLLALALGLSALGILCWRWLVSAWRFRPPLTEVALRVERLRPELAGRLATSVEFLQHHPAPALEMRALGLLGGLITPDTFRGLLRLDRVGRAAAGLVVAVGAMLAVVALDPASAGIALRRMLIPWSGAEWPPRTLVESAMGSVTHHPRGRALILRASAVRGDEEGMRAHVRYRYVEAGVPGAWREAVLTRQPGGVFERPVETDAEAIEFSFGTLDAETQVSTIQLVPPPAVVSASLASTPPAYAPASLAQRAELGPGTDARAVLAAPLLAGSQVTLDLELSRPLPVPAEPAALEAWAARTFVATLPGVDAPLPGAAAPVDQQAPSAPAISVSADPARPGRLTLSMRADRDVEMDVRLEDEHGIRNADTIRYRILASTDKGPAASIPQPAADDMVLPGSRIPVTAEGRDDVAVRAVGIRVERQARAGEQGPQALGSGALDGVKGMVAVKEGAAPTLAVEQAITPSTLEARPGDTLLVSAVAVDAFALDGHQHEPAISAPRRLRVVAPEEYARQIRSQLASVRQSAIRAEQQQRQLMEAAAADEHGHLRQETRAAAGELARRQSQLSDRIGAARDAVKSLEERTRDGGLGDQALTDILRQAADILDQAGRSGTRAAESLRTMEQAAREGNSAADRQAESAAADARTAQEETRAELEDLAKLLDRDEDAWVATRQLERLSEEINALVRETRRVGEQAVGRDAQELTPEQKASVDRLAARDRAAADAARDALEELQDRASRLEAADRTRAAGMRQAAKEGQERDVSRRLSEAAGQTERNQPTNAEQNLRQAADAVQAMLDQMKDDRSARVEELRRQMASLEENLRRLLTQAESAAVAVSAATDLVTISAASERMQSLDRNVASVVEEARAAGQAGQRTARTLDRAAERTLAAATALAAKPAQLPEAAEAAERARDLIKDALDQIRTQREKAERQQSEERREKLATAYRALSEKQAGLRTASEPLKLPAGTQADRRQLVEGRRLGIDQQLVRTELSRLLKESADLARSELFADAHARLDGWLGTAADKLSRVAVDQIMLDEQQLAVETLATMAEALSDHAPGGDDPFAMNERGDDQQGGEGGEQQESSIPPLAELRLLRGMQDQLARRTRAVDEQHLDPAARAAVLKELGRLQQRLQEQGEAWMEKLKEQAGGGGGGASGGAGGAEGAHDEGDAAGGGLPVPPSALPAAWRREPQGGAAAPPPADKPAPPVNTAPAPGAPPSGSNATPAPAAPPAPKTLDDLLGLEPAAPGRKGPDAPGAGSGAAGTQAGGDAGRGGQGDGVAERGRQDALSRSLNEDELEDAFKAAVEGMKRSAQALAVDGDPGIETQRLQQDVVRKLEILIDSAKKKQKQKSQQSRSNRQDRQEQQQDQRQQQQQAQQEEAQRQQEAQKRRQQQQQAQRQPATDANGNPIPPELQEGALNNVMEDGRTEWGALPARIRDLVQQGRRDRVSSLYQRLTEQYYRRMAEEASK